jgi:ribosomal protein S18 acetylase RimI-like enzyme
MEPMRIRACTHNDIDAVLQLDRQWEEEQIAHDFLPISREEFLTALERFPAYFLVAESDGGIVGYIQGVVRLRKWVAVLPDGEPYVEIENVYVHPDFRHRDIGGQLMERLMAVAAQQGIQRFVVSSTSKEMDKILHFYRRHGFTPWYVQRERNKNSDPRGVTHSGIPT